MQSKCLLSCSTYYFIRLKLTFWNLKTFKDPANLNVNGKKYHRVFLFLKNFFSCHRNTDFCNLSFLRYMSNSFAPYCCGFPGTDVTGFTWYNLCTVQKHDSYFVEKKLTHKWSAKGHIGRGKQSQKFSPYLKHPHTVLTVGWDFISDHIYFL